MEYILMSLQVSITVLRRYTKEQWQDPAGGKLRVSLTAYREDLEQRKKLYTWNGDIKLFDPPEVYDTSTMILYNPIKGRAQDKINSWKRRQISYGELEEILNRGKLEKLKMPLAEIKKILNKRSRSENHYVSNVLDEILPNIYTELFDRMLQSNSGGKKDES